MLSKIVCGLCIALAPVGTLQAQEPGRADRVQEFIRQARTRLGERLATTAEQVIQGHVRAIGGREAVEAVRTLMVRGRNLILSAEVRPLVRYFQQPDRLRQQAPGGLSYVLVAGNTVFQVDAAGGRTEVRQRWTRALVHTRLDGDFLDYQQRGIVVEYLGLEGFATEPSVLYHLKRTFPDGYFEDLFFDVDTGLLRMVQENGDASYRRVFYEYRDVGGTLFPHLQLTVFEGVTPPHVFVVDEVRVNVAVAEGFFR